MKKAGPLAGAGILVTRPARQAERLCALIEAAGGEALRFPTIAIAPCDAALAHPATAYDWAVFLSPNAVEHGLARLGPSAACPRLAAVGPGTARALAARGQAEVLHPPGDWRSEGLLALPEFADVAGRRILLVRGRGGRELLAETLAARGARVDVLEVYERRIPEADLTPLLQWWENGHLHAITVTSNAALANLNAMLPGPARAWLRRTQVVGVSARVLQLADALGIEIPPLVSAAPDDAALVETLSAWWSSRRQERA